MKNIFIFLLFGFCNPFICGAKSIHEQKIQPVGEAAAPAKPLLMQPKKFNDGEEIDPSQNPFTISLFKDGEFFCSGTVVGTRPPTVITAAHCMYEHEKNAGKIEMHFYDKPKGPPIVFQMKSYKTDPAYARFMDLYRKFIEYTESKGVSIGTASSETFEKVRSDFFASQSPPITFEQWNQFSQQSSARDVALLVFHGELETRGVPPVIVSQTASSEKNEMFGLVGFGDKSTSILNSFVKRKKRTGLVVGKSDDMNGSHIVAIPDFTKERKKAYPFWRPQVFSGDSGGSLYALRRVGKAQVLQGVVHGGAGEPGNPKLWEDIYADLGLDSNQAFLKEASKDLNTSLQFSQK